MEEPGSSVVEEEIVDLSGAEDGEGVARAEGSTRRDMHPEPEPEVKLSEHSGSPANPR